MKRGREWSGVGGEGFRGIMQILAFRSFLSIFPLTLRSLPTFLNAPADIHSERRPAAAGRLPHSKEMASGGVSTRKFYG